MNQFSLIVVVVVIAISFAVVESTMQANQQIVTGESIPTISKVTLSPLPYDYTALEPYISEQTLRFHHDKHHAKYVENTLLMTQGTERESMTLEEIMISSYSSAKDRSLFNNAAQSWNHAFYWQCMRPPLGGSHGPAEGSKIMVKIQEHFGSYENFRKQFSTSATAVFGSGWAWLVKNPLNNNKFEIVQTVGGDNPMTQGLVPLLVVDVWEHAYYLDYQNLRPKYIDAFLDYLVNWDFVASRL